MVNIFIDWGIQKQHVALIEEKSEEEIQSTQSLRFSSVKELVESLKTFNNGKAQEFSVFMEAGCPKFFIYRLLKEGFKVNLCSGVVISKLRGSREKTDEKDVEYIKELYKKFPDNFHCLTCLEERDIHLNSLMSLYLKLTKDCANIKNRQFAYNKEFGEKSEIYCEIIKNLGRQKINLLREIQPYVQEDYKKVKTRGLSIRIVAGLLTCAHPKKFSSLSKYLAYCGYKESSKLNHKFNRTAKTTAWLAVDSFVKLKNPIYKPLYDKIKQDMKTRFPEDSKGKIDGKTKLRVATFFLKNFYWSLK